MAQNDPSAPAPRGEQLLRSLPSRVQPEEGAAERIRRRVMQRVSTPELLRIARESVRPDVRASQRVWSRIAPGFTPASAPLWDRIRAAATPADAARQRLWARVSERLNPAPVLSVLISRPLKFAAAFTILLFVVRASPLLFLAPPTVAESAVTVMPTAGEVSVLIGGLWQPLRTELQLRNATMLQTAEGEATIVLHDDAVLRMGPRTTLALNDFTDRPAAPEASPSVFLQGGRLWVLGLVPRHLEGISIGTAQGRVMVHEGSVSIEDAGASDVRVWHRSAMVTRRGQQLGLVAGERALLERTSRLSIARIDSDAYDGQWVSHNLAMDAAHQREIALMQQERRAASAGILPTSTLYPAKRLAEAVDVLFTLNPEAKARKQITHANTRLNEAAALLSAGSGEGAADAALREYREAMVAVASGATVSPALESLVLKEVMANASADVAAALPDDAAYALKQTVRDTIAALPDSMDKPDVETAELLDELSSVKRRVDEGEVQAAKVELEKIRTDLPGLADSTAALSPDIRKEVEATLSTVVAAVEPELPEPEEQVAQVSRATSRTLNEESRSRRPTAAKAVEPLTDAELEAMVVQIRNRVVEAYHTPEGRQIQLQREFNRLNGHPDQGRILRRLSQVLPQDGLATVVRSEIREVADEKGTLSEPLGAGCTGSGC